MGRTTGTYSPELIGAIQSKIQEFHQQWAAKIAAVPAGPSRESEVKDIKKRLSDEWFLTMDPQYPMWRRVPLGPILSVKFHYVVHKPIDTLPPEEVEIYNWIFERLKQIETRVNLHADTLAKSLGCEEVIRTTVAKTCSELDAVWRDFAIRFPSYQSFGNADALNIELKGKGVFQFDIQ